MQPHTIPVIELNQRQKKRFDKVTIIEITQIIRVFQLAPLEKFPISATTKPANEKSGEIPFKTKATSVKELKSTSIDMVEIKPMTAINIETAARRIDLFLISLNINHWSGHGTHA
tara:strand:- start:1 stop:345 length:345 start_codon:yes stop_codon:yes gene_type:complete